MRIVGGSARGRRVKSPPGHVRPTSDRVREALFSIIQNSIKDATFLDLFAGSGAIGLEALSRGARHVVFVDDNAARAAAISRHIEEFGWTDRATVLRLTAKRFLAKSQKTFDIVFLDPPYHSDQMNTAISRIAEGGVVVDGGLLVLEHSSSSPTDEKITGFLPAKRYRYGDTTLSIYLTVA